MAEILEKSVFLEATQINLAYWISKGEEGSRKDLPIVIFVHGFPELAFSWKDQMLALSERGFTCVAPDMRGYGKSSAPNDAEKYRLQDLTGDLIALMDQELQVEKCVFIGHDWGGFVVWTMALQYESRCVAVGSLNTPLPFGIWTFENPMKYFLDNPEKDAGELDYQVYFNLKDIPENELDADVERTIHGFFRSQTKDKTRKEHLENMKLGVRTAKARKSNNRGILFHAPQKIPRDTLWSEEEMKVYISSFEKKGFFGPLSWYRNIDENLEWFKRGGVSSSTKVRIPTLMVTAEYDVVLNPKLTDGMENQLLNLSRGQ